MHAYEHIQLLLQMYLTNSIGVEICLASSLVISIDVNCCHFNEMAMALRCIYCPSYKERLSSTSGLDMREVKNHLTYFKTL